MVHHATLKIANVIKIKLTFKKRSMKMLLNAKNIFKTINYDLYRKIFSYASTLSVSGNLNIWLLMFFKKQLSVLVINIWTGFRKNFFYSKFKNQEFDFK